MTINEHTYFARWNWMNYGMSADFLEYYVSKHPEPPENPWHSDLKTILEAMRCGEAYSAKMLQFNKHEPIACDYQI